MSEKLQCTIKIKSVEIVFFNKLRLDDVLVIGKQNDTILQMQTAKANIGDFNFWNTNRQYSYFNNIELEHGIANIVMQKDGLLNIDFLLPKSKNKNSKKTFTLTIKNIELNDIKLNYTDSINGIESSNNISYLKLNNLSLNDKNKYLSIESIENKGAFKVAMFEKNKIIDRTLEKNIDTVKWNIRLNKIVFDKIDFYYNNKVKPTSDKPFDENHFYLIGLKTQINNFTFYDSYFKPSQQIIAFDLEKLQTVLNGNYKIHHIQSKVNIKTKVKFASFQNSIVQAENTSISGNFMFDFANKETFSDDIKFLLATNESNIYLDDMAYFVPALRKNYQLKTLFGQPFILTAEISNTLRNIHINQLKLHHNRLGNANMQGTIRDITSLNNMFFDIEVNDLTTDIHKIKTLLPPNVKWNNNLNNIGNIRLQGHVMGKIYDIAGELDVKTNVGSMNGSVAVNLGHDFKQKKYKADVSTSKLNIAKLTNRNDLGLISGKISLDGSGFNLDELNSKIKAELTELDYKNYKYSNISIDGTFIDKIFDGKLVSNDKNLTLNFAGKIDLKEKNPTFDLNTKVENISLADINFGKNNLRLSGEIIGKFKGNNLDNLVGNLSLKNVTIADSSKKYYLKFLDVVAQKDSTRRSLTIASDVINASFQGEYTFDKVAPAFKQMLRNYFPKMFPDIELANHTEPQLIDFKIKINEPNEILSLFAKNISVDEGLVEGNINTKNNTFLLRGKVPNFSIKNVDVVNTVFYAQSANKGFMFKIKDDYSLINDSTRIRNTNVQGLFYNDSLRFDIKLSQDEQRYNLNLKGIFTSDSTRSGKIVLLPSDIVINNKAWTIQEDNYIRFTDKKFESRNIRIKNGNQQIYLANTTIANKKSLAQLKLENILVEEFYNIIKNPRFQISGLLNGEIAASDIITKNPKIEANFSIQNTTVNKDNYGLLLVKANTENYKEMINVEASVNGEKGIADIKGNINPTSKTKNLDLFVNTKKASPRFLEYLLAPNIKGVKGELSAQAKVSGTFKKIELSGSAYGKNAEVVIDYLKTRYRIREVQVLITPTGFIINKTPIVDDNNHFAIVQANIQHRSFKDWSINADITADEFLALNTTKRDNPLYYGKANVKGDISFRGPFDNLNMYINATSKKGTVLTIPFNTTRDSSKVDFVKFTSAFNNENDTTIAAIPEYKSKIKGMNIEMNMNINNDAEIRLIMDPIMNDSLTCRGDGIITLKYDAKGALEMFGDYTINSGKYGFSYNNGLLPTKFQKQFDLRNGGTISWKGSPYDATINADAIYKTQAIPYDFIADLIANDQRALIESRARTDVDLFLQLRNNLINPDINFDFELTSASSTVRSYTNTKLRLIRDNQNEVNRQVFGLIIMGRFLPSGIDNNNISATAAGINTISEILSSQTTSYFNSILQEFITDGEVAFNYSIYDAENFDISNPTRLNRNSVQVDFRKKLINDRVTVNIGGNFDFGNNSFANRSTNQIAGDFSIEYTIDEEGRIKIRAYRIGEPNIYQSRNRNRTGVAFTYQVEFNNWDDLIESWKQKKQAKKNLKIIQEENLRKEEEITVPTPAKSNVIN